MLLTEEEFFKLRVDRVRTTASLYDLLEEAGHPPRYKGRSGQMKCVFGATAHQREDTKPSARYYPSGERNDYDSYYCFYCTERPLDAIYFLVRLKGIRYTEALRLLEHQYNITYQDVEVSKDISIDLDALREKAKEVDPGPVFGYCENHLVENKALIGLQRYVVLCLALDKIYFKHDDAKPSDTVLRLEKWKAAVGKVIDKRTQDAQPE